MSFYTVKNKYFPNTELCKKFLPSGICQDIFSMSSDFSKINDESEILNVPAQKTEFVPAIRSYILRQKNQSALRGSSLSIGDPDYKPVAFLERAFRLSASVCRITQSMPFGNLIPLIKNWKPQDVPEMRKALEDFFKSPPIDSSWEEYWKAATFEGSFKNNDLDGRACANNQQAISVPYATGFLVGKSHVLTNFHVLNATEHEKNLDDFRVQFRYERNLNNRDLRPTEYKIKSILSGDSDLDYTLLEIEKFPEIEIDFSEKLSLSEEDLKRVKLLKAQLSFEQAGENFGWLRMNSDRTVIPNISPKQIENVENQLNLNSDKKEEQALLEKCKRRGGIQGEPTIIIQHPRGRSKEIVAFNSNITKASDLYIQYTTDTDFGSSGSPILNGNLQLIGIHFGALIEYEVEQLQQEKSKPGSIPKSQIPKPSITIKSNLGTRISAVVKHLKKIKTDELNDFIEEYVDDKPLVQRRIFLLGGLERNISGDAKFTQKLVEEMIRRLKKNQNPLDPDKPSQEIKDITKYTQVEIIDALGDITPFSRDLKNREVVLEPGAKPISENQQFTFNKLRILSDPQLPLKMAIAWINTVCDLGDGGDLRAYRPGDVALQLVTDKYESEELQLKLKQLKRKSLVEQESDPLPRGMLVYHISDNRERRSHAELVLDRLSEGVPALRSRGALSDSTSLEGRHTFCRDLYMPSLIINLGFLEHPLDQQVLGANEEKILDEDKLKKLAEELLEAVIAWSDALNPVSFSPN
jgi:V8-like Glu-specific endopeptidase